MKILYISDGPAPGLAEHEVQHRRVRDTPSLVMAVRDFAADAYVLDQREGLDYSLPHILSAAQMAAAKERRFILLGDYEIPKNSFLQQRSNDEALPKDLKQRRRGPVKAAAQTRAKLPEPKPKEEKIRPLGFADRRTHLVTVAGSEARTGCTTQCLGLYHYFRALGYEPAVMASEERVSAWSRLMDGKRTDTGVAVLEGIPFLSGVGMQPPYDLFLEDCGVLEGDNLKNFLNGELKILVCGVKLWELQETANALALLRGQKDLAVIVSFATESAARKALAPLLERLEIQGPILAAPWQPDAFSAGDLRPYDSGLRALLERRFQSPLATRRKKIWNEQEAAHAADHD